MQKKILYSLTLVIVSFIIPFIIPGFATKFRTWKKIVPILFGENFKFPLKFFVGNEKWNLNDNFSYLNT